MTARRLIVTLVAALLAVQVVRNAAVDSLAEVNPRSAASLWSGHPAVALSLGMAEIGAAARQRKPAPADSVAKIIRASAKAPLAPEPFLVEGIQAQIAGDGQGAGNAFLAAQRRDPRSLPARYFLAEHYFRSGDAARGLDEIAVLARLSPNGIQGSAPYIGAYARSPSNWPHLRAMFRSNPQIEDAALVALAVDPANADTILALASPGRRSADSPWLPGLLNGLVGAGQYARARTIWSVSAGVGNGGAPLLYDPGFARPGAPPPFNWRLTSSSVGLAERQPGGRLHAIFYGQEDGALAQQLVVLAPGTYRLSMRVLGDASQTKTLSWSVRCANSHEPLATASLDVLAAHVMRFQVPADCPAEWIELLGTSSDMPQQSDVTINRLTLQREASNG